MRPYSRIASGAIGLCLLACTFWLTATTNAAEAAKPEIRRTDIQVDGGRPLAGERSRMAIDSQGNVCFTYTLTAHKHSYLALGKITPARKVSLDAAGSETTWNVEGWGTVGWPSDLAIDKQGNLHFATRYHGRPYGVDYWLRKDGRWTLETFGHDLSFGGNTIALGLLPDQSPVVLAIDTNRTKLRVWEKQSGQWKSTLPPLLEGVSAGDFDMAVGPKGELWVAFAPAGRSPVIATRSPQGEWSRETIDKTQGASMFSTCLDGQNQPHVAYSARIEAGPTKTLRHATLDASGQWRVRTLATASEGHHVGRTDLAFAGDTLAIAWEEGPGPRLVPKDYGNVVGGVNLTVLGRDKKAMTHALASEHAGRPSVALSADGDAAYVGVYSGNAAGDDFYLLSVGLRGKPAPQLTAPTETPEDVLAQACLHEIESGDPTAIRRGLERLDASRISPSQRRALVEKYREHENFRVRIHAVRELAKSPDLIVALRDQLAAVVADPNHAVRQSFYTNVLVDDQTAPMIMPLLYKALASLDAVDRLAAAELLNKHAKSVDTSKLAAALATLSSDLGNEDSSRRGSAGMAMEYLASFPETEMAARSAIEKGSPLAQAAACLVLWRINKPFELSLLSAAMASDSETAQLTACGLIGQVRTAEGVPLLQRALASESSKVRAAAVYALRSVAMVSELAEVATHPNGFPLTALRMRDPNSPAEKARHTAATKVLQEALIHQDANVREKAASALARVAAKDSLPSLEKLLHDSDASVRTAAITATEVLQDSPDSKHLIDLKAWQLARSARRQFKVNPIHREPTTVVDGIVEVASDKQLLIDDFVIDETKNLKRRMHSFKKHAPQPCFAIAGSLGRGLGRPVHVDDYLRSWGADISHVVSVWSSSFAGRICGL